MGKPFWRNNGVEDNFLNQLFKEGKITKKTKPGDLKRMHPEIFGDFTIDVIRNHLKIFKKKNGCDFSENENGDSNKNVEDEDNSNQISIDVSSPSNIKKADERITHINQPFIMSTFKDSDTQIEKVFLLVNIFSGATNVNIDINEFGEIVTVSYNWNKLLYDTDDFLQNFESNKSEIKSTIQNELRKIRKNICDAPRGIIEIKLPIVVQTGYNSWVKKGIKREDGTLLLMAIFTGIIEDYSKNPNVTSVKFV